MAGEEDLRARAVLAEMLMRISQGPHAALSILESASAEQVRAAFLQLTKQFHPARFATHPPEIYKMANEVFLGVKEAHDHLVKVLGSTGRQMPSGSNAVPIAGGPGGTVRGTGLVPKNNPLGRGSDRPGTRPSTPVLQNPGAGMPRAASPLTPSGRARPPTPQVTQPLPRSPTPQATQPLPRSPTPAIGVPMQRSTTPSGDPERRTTPSTGVPAQPRPTSPLGTVRPSTPPGQRTATPDLAPGTIRYSGVQPAQPASSSSSTSIPKVGGTGEDAELKHAMNLLSSKDWTGARLAFHALAAKVPQSRQYRALLCYVRGRETMATGRNDDAAMEFQRALQLDPDLQIAKDALRDLGRKGRW